MSISASQIAPLLKGTYTDRASAWAVVERVLVPGFGQGLTRLWRPGLESSRQDFALEVMADLGERVIKNLGIPSPRGEPPSDYTAWLRTVLVNAARDKLRSAAKAEERTRKRHVELDETRTPAPPEAPGTQQPSDATRAQALAELAARSPLYVLALYCWTDPSLITPPLLEAATRVSRGHSESGTGLVRPVDETLRLLKSHRAQLESGVERNRSAQELVAWILRSDDPSFDSWVTDRARVKAAREAIAKWNQRARTTLKEAGTNTAAEEA